MMGIEGGALTWTSADGRGWETGEALQGSLQEQSIAAIGDTVVFFTAEFDSVASVLETSLLIGTVRP